jgi:hypothetical protein
MDTLTTVVTETRAELRDASSDKLAGLKLVGYDALLFVIGCIGLLMAKAFPHFMTFWATVSLGAFIILFLTIMHFYFSERALSKAQKKQKDNIIPGYCPDYWTKVVDPSTGKVVCKNGFSTKTSDGKTMTIRFSDSSVPDKIDIQTVATSTNAYKCNLYGSVIQFPAPWMEMKAKCDGVAF